MENGLNYGDYVRLKALDFSLETSRSLIFASVTILSGLIVLLGEKKILKHDWTLWILVGAFSLSILFSFAEIIVTYLSANEGKVDPGDRQSTVLKLLPIVFFVIGYGVGVAIIVRAY